MHNKKQGRQLPTLHSQFQKSHLLNQGDLFSQINAG